MFVMVDRLISCRPGAAPPRAEPAPRLRALRPGRPMVAAAAGDAGNARPRVPLTVDFH